LKYIDDYRDKDLVEIISSRIKKATTRPWTIMEICGGQTHSIMRYGLQEFLPSSINLIHGPGCPVCVTPLELIDKAIFLSSLEDVILTSFGDMLRVPGSDGDLLRCKARGADIRIVYSPLDVLKIAKENPGKKVVFFAIGFETTAPSVALTVQQARIKGIDNFSILCSHVLVPPAIRAIMSLPGTRIQGFLAAGHVCAVMGYHEYFEISEKYMIPIVVTGFEPVDILSGILKTVEQLESGSHTVENAYGRVVTEAGNIPAQLLLKDVFEPADRKWRGIGIIEGGGLRLREEYSSFDAEKVFSLDDVRTIEPEGCIAGEILQGLKRPDQCASFRKTCTPDSPLGAPMVSSEGACAAYYRYSGNEKAVYDRK
jgi:hydrogenase expression/formation protein HypD